MATTKKVVEVSDVVEDVKDLVEDSIELVETQVSWVAKNAQALAILTTVACAAGGVFLGYTIAKKKLEAKYQAIADEQVADVKAHYAILNKEGENGDLEALASKYAEEEVAAVEEVIESEGYRSYNKVQSVTEEEVVAEEVPVEEEEVVERNVFESEGPDTYFVFAEELVRRVERPTEPCVITKDEFDSNESEYDQNTLTYYDGDDVLADAHDSPIDDKDAVVGYENLLRFGHGSGDPNVVYIRNPRLQLEFELVHSDGKFAKEVLGFDDELQHSDRRPRKFRSYDE